MWWVFVDSAYIRFHFSLSLVSKTLFMYLKMTIYINLVGLNILSQRLKHSEAIIIIRSMTIPTNTLREHIKASSQVLLASDSFHLRTTPSTCFSFIASRQLLEKDSDIFFIPKMADHLLFTMLSCAKNRRLLSPIQGLSTHCMEKWMSPGVDWRSLQHFNVISSSS